MGPKKRKNNKRPIPLAPPAMRSRKKARVVTTLFHKHTRDRELAINRGDEDAVRECDEKLAEMGGRDEYQRASQLSTSYHSTSRWVLGVLTRSGWLYGIPVDHTTAEAKKNKQKPLRRKMRLLEIGAINTELLDAASKTVSVDASIAGRAPQGQDAPKYKLDVRAIDLNSSHEGIEEADFLMLPLCHKDPSQRYDAIVCSMVINCVPTPEKRGHVLSRLFHQLRPGGLCFLTLPKLCLTQSPYMTRESFEGILTAGVGFELQEKKESPKISFFILRRPLSMASDHHVESRWRQVKRLNKGKKYRNDFSVVLGREMDEESIFSASETRQRGT